MNLCSPQPCPPGTGAPGPAACLPSVPVVEAFRQGPYARELSIPAAGAVRVARLPPSPWRYPEHGLVTRPKAHASAWAEVELADVHDGAPAVSHPELPVVPGQ